MKKLRKVAQPMTLPLPVRPPKVVPRKIGLKAATARAQTIRRENVHRHKAHQEAIAMNERIRLAQVHNQMSIERDHLLGASLHGKLQAHAYNRLQELKTLLAK